MAYQCQNFKDGQVLTAECLNKIERALEGVCKKEIQAINVNAQNEIIVTFADGSTMNCGKVNVSGGGSGADGITPNIGPNGNWWIGGTDTGVKAAGTNGVDGKDGKTPYIQNGYWYIDGVNTNVKAQGVDGKDGTNGADGVSPVVTVTSITGGNRITITDKNGTKTVDVMDGADGNNGKDGINGTDGKDGRGIKSIVRTSGTGAAGTTDTYTITYTDNTTSTLTVYNGKNGTNGTSVTVKSVSESTEDGGSNVVTFSDGKTMTVKNGKDYVLTDADMAEIVADVIAAMGTPIAGTIDENKVITLGGDLAEGTYTLRWITKDGYAQICSLTVDGNGEITPPETPDTPDEPVAPDTTLVLQPGVKIDSATGAETTGNAGYSASDYVEIVEGYTYTIHKKSSISEGLKVVYYDANKNFMSTSGDVIVATTAQKSAVIPLTAGASFFRLRIYGTASLLDEANWELTAEVSA